MSMILHMLTGEGEQYLSSKRVITFVAFLLVAVGFVAETFFGYTLNQFTVESLMYIVLGGLGFTASEKFSRKESKNDLSK
jgi:hypothetical protein